LRSADQNFAEKDIESLDWNELLNLKRSFSSYLKQLTNDIIEIETSKLQSVNNKIQSNTENLKSLLGRSKEIRSSIKTKNSDFLAIGQKISQSKDFLSTMESRVTNETEDVLIHTINVLTKSLEDKQYATENEKNRISQEIKDRSMEMEAIKAVHTIKQGLNELNQQADAFKENIKQLDMEDMKMNNQINSIRIALDALYIERRKLSDERSNLLNSYNTVLQKLELVNLQMDKISKVRRQRVQTHGQYISDSAILKVKEEAKRKLESGSKLSFEELKLLYNDGD
jgi:uncharacterized coiled-coil DUF342 family protein